MTDEYAGGWPFPTRGRLIRAESYDPDVDGAVSAIVSVAAERLDTDPLSLPVLHDRIDPDCLDPLLVRASSDRPDGVRVAVEVSFWGTTVLARDDGGLGVYRDGEEPADLRPAVAVEHEWEGRDPLVWSIGRAIAAAADGDPNEVTSRLIDRLDTDAIDRLLRPLADGTPRVDGRLLLSIDGYEVAVEPTGEIAVESSLSVLKRSGAALLLVGSVPEPGFDRASATLLGEPDGDRSPLFVLHGRGVDTARRRFDLADVSPGTGTVLEHSKTARAASTAEGEVHRPDAEGPRVVPVSGEVSAIPDAVRGAIGDAGPPSSGALRLCVDSLRSMVESADLETAGEAVDAICRTVRHHRGIGHVLLPGTPNDEELGVLGPSFDAIVELRTGEASVEQRWCLTATGHRTGWFPL